MHFQTHLLPEVGGVGSQFVERASDLLDGLLLGHIGRKSVRLDLGSAAANIVAEFNEFLGALDGFSKHVRIGIVEILIAAHPHQSDRTVLELLPHGEPLGVGQARFDTMGMLGAQFDAQGPRGFAVF